MNQFFYDAYFNEEEHLNIVKEMYGENIKITKSVHKNKLYGLKIFPISSSIMIVIVLKTSKFGHVIIGISSTSLEKFDYRDHLRECN